MDPSVQSEEARTRAKAETPGRGCVGPSVGLCHPGAGIQQPGGRGTPATSSHRDAACGGRGRRRAGTALLSAASGNTEEVAPRTSAGDRAVLRPPRAAAPTPGHGSKRPMPLGTLASPELPQESVQTGGVTRPQQGAQRFPSPSSPTREASPRPRQGTGAGTEPGLGADARRARPRDAAETPGGRVHAGQQTARVPRCPPPGPTAPSSAPAQGDPDPSTALGLGSRTGTGAPWAARAEGSSPGLGRPGRALRAGGGGGTGPLGPAPT